MKKMIMIVSILLALPFSAFAEEVTVAAAANVQFTVEELKNAFEQETGLKVNTVIGSSGKLTTQIENGAPFDIFLSADMDYPDTLYKEGLACKEPQVYAYGTLVLWTLKDNLDLSKGIAVLTDSLVKKIAIANPKSAPYGRKAVDALKFSHLYQEVNKKLVYGENITQASQFIIAQAADIGFTSKSIVLSSEMIGRGKWIEVDSQSYERIAQGVVILTYAKKQHFKAAEKFYNFLFSDKGKEIFKKYGYILP
jgi:molybdate transport system substrate-binding protein